MEPSFRKKGPLFKCFYDLPLSLPASPSSARAYIGEKEPMVPLVGAVPLPVIVLFPRDWKVPALLFRTPKIPLFAKTQLE
jgi:hypothetical protein